MRTWITLVLALGAAQAGLPASAQAPARAPMAAPAASAATASAPTAAPAAAPTTAAECSKAAKAVFDKAHPQPKKQVRKDYQRHVSYKSGFVATSKSCYLLEEIVLIKPDGAPARTGRKLTLLAGENRQQLGHFVGPDKPVQCQFDGKPCAGGDKWIKLAQTRMKQ